MIITTKSTVRKNNENKDLVLKNPNLNEVQQEQHKTIECMKNNFIFNLVLGWSRNRNRNRTRNEFISSPSASTSSSSLSLALPPPPPPIKNVGRFSSVEGHINNSASFSLGVCSQFHSPPPPLTPMSGTYCGLVTEWNDETGKVVATQRITYSLVFSDTGSIKGSGHDPKTEETYPIEGDWWFDKKTKRADNENGNHNCKCKFQWREVYNDLGFGATVEGDLPLFEGGRRTVIEGRLNPSLYPGHSCTFEMSRVQSFPKDPATKTKRKSKTKNRRKNKIERRTKTKKSQEKNKTKTIQSGNLPKKMRAPKTDEKDFPFGFTRIIPGNKNATPRNGTYIGSAKQWNARMGETEATIVKKDIKYSLEFNNDMTVKGSMSVSAGHEHDASAVEGVGQNKIEGHWWFDSEGELKFSWTEHVGDSEDKKLEGDLVLKADRTIIRGKHCPSPPIPGYCYTFEIVHR